MAFSRLYQLGIIFKAILLSCAVVFRYGPTDTTMALGKTAVLQCAATIDNNNEVISWFHVESNQILSKDENILSLEDRYSIIGNHESKGEYYLTIRNVMRSDEGEYRCMSGADFRSATLKVIVPPPQDYPMCDVTPAPAVNQPGELTQLSCSSQGGFPPVRLTWKRHGIIISPTVTNANHLQRVVYEEDNGVPYTCFASSAALEYSRSCTVMVLNIPPTAEIKPMEQEVRAGDTATFECTGHGIPAVISYQWLVNYAPVNEQRIPRYSVDKTNRTLRINNVRRWEHGSLIICEVSIESGLKGRADARLNVHSLPVTVGKGPDSAGSVIPTAHPNMNAHPAQPKGRIHITDHTGALIGSVIGTMLLLAIVLILTCLVLRAKLKQMGVEIITFNVGFCKRKYKTKNAEDFPIYAKPNKIRNQAPPPPDAPRPDRSTLVRAVTLPRSENLELKSKQKIKKQFSNYERIDIVPKPVCIKSENTIEKETDLSLTSNHSNGDGIVYADLEMNKACIPAPDVVSSCDAVAYAQLRL